MTGAPWPYSATNAVSRPATGACTAKPRSLSQSRSSPAERCSASASSGWPCRSRLSARSGSSRPAIASSIARCTCSRPAAAACGASADTYLLLSLLADAAGAAPGP